MLVRGRLSDCECPTSSLARAAKLALRAPLVLGSAIVGVITQVSEHPDDVWIMGEIYEEKLVTQQCTYGEYRELVLMPATDDEAQASVVFARSKPWPNAYPSALTWSL